MPEKFAPLNLSREELIEYTHHWKGERTSDGRPKVPDGILERMREVTITEAWEFLTNAGFKWQYEGEWYTTHPDDTLVGRALTAIYMPRRPDMRMLMEEKGARLGCVGDQISWPIDMLVKGDIYVADVYGKILDGPVIGDNLATAIFAKSGKGVVHNASVRDVERVKKIPGFTSFYRGWHPSYASPTIMLLGVNTPVRIGHATVMPGDIVLGKNNGVIFIPPHLAEQVVKKSELVRLRDQFGQLRLKEGKYTPGEIDVPLWNKIIETDFWNWLEDNKDSLTVSSEVIHEILNGKMEIDDNEDN